MSRTVYIVTTERNGVKIGIAKDPRSRMSGMQTSTPIRLSLYRAYATSEAAALAIEQRSHAVLVNHRIGGEWFEVDPTMADAAVQRAASDLGHQLSTWSPPLAIRGTPWQRRLRSAGLTQKRLAGLLGVYENTVSRQMKGEVPMPGYVVAFITAWEAMTPDQREAWLAAIDKIEKDGPWPV